ncbi:M56 family metallopeptidase [Streptosporangium sp. NPDC001681]|uniref:M56 family metallopeptidase n=1 Tax=Streptosporangium sp. NPDC001681 TaxID=3154395 RepID=UPI00331A2EF6
MIALVLGAYTTLAACTLHLLIGRVRRLGHAPRLSIAVWLAGCGSMIVSGMLTGLELAFPSHAIGDELAALLTACSELLAGHSAAATPRPLIALGGLLAAGLIFVRVGYCTASVLFLGRRGRAQHRSAVRLVGRQDRELGALVVRHDEPAAYCVPGRGGLIVITSGTLATLGRQHVAAVLAHERAHLAGRHHLLLACAQALVRAFPWIPLFVRASREVPRHVELLADDVAAREHPRTVIAAALIAVAGASTPIAAMGAGGETALIRIRRLLSPASPALCRREKILGALGVGGLLAGPAVVLVLPSLIVFLATCPALT